MAFGNKITELSQIVVGTAGYMVQVDTTLIRVRSIEGVQVQVADDDTPEPVTVPTASLAELSALVNGDATTLLAYYFANGSLFIYLDATEYPYVDATRFAIIATRNAINMVLDTDNADFKDEDIELFLAYCIQMAYLMSNRPVPPTVQNLIRTKETLIRTS